MSKKLTIKRTITSSYDHLNDEATIKLQNEIGETVQCIVYEVNTMMDKALLQAIPIDKLTALYGMVKNEFDSRGKIAQCQNCISYQDWHTDPSCGDSENRVLFEGQEMDMVCNPTHSCHLHKFKG